MVRDWSRRHTQPPLVAMVVGSTLLGILVVVYDYYTILKPQKLTHTKCSTDDGHLTFGSNTTILPAFVHAQSVSFSLTCELSQERSTSILVNIIYAHI